MITPSKYQQDIYQFVQESLTGTRQNLIISATAGSGKSTTIKELLRYIPKNMTVLYLTFMREVNLDLSAKVKKMVAELNGQAPRAVVRTCHSIGNACLLNQGIKGDPTQNGRKYNHLCQQYLKAHMPRYNAKLAEQLVDLVNKVRLTLSDTDAMSLMTLIHRYNIDIDFSESKIWPLILKGVPMILQAGIKMAKDKIDFTDQIWLPSSKALNLEPARYDVVMIDEAQDLSPCIRELALKAVKPSGMVISVGDRKQAIMSFAGASCRSLDEIKEMTDAVELPLNKNYRCPKAVIRLAQTLVPEIEAHEEAEEGEIEYIPPASVADLAQTGDMILCRWNAPLISMAIDLIRMRKRCLVKGKDLGADVASFLDRVGKYYEEQSSEFVPDMMFEDIYYFVKEYEAHRTEILRQNEEENEQKINKLKDHCATLLALYDGYQEKVSTRGNYHEFRAFIEKFFTAHGETKGEVRNEDRKDTITLSTGHKAKGLENPNVFILEYDELPSEKAITEEAREQEINLLYVMITRPKKKLYCVVKNPEDYTEKDGELNTDEVVAAATEIINESMTVTSIYDVVGFEDYDPAVVDTLFHDGLMSSYQPRAEIAPEYTQEAEATETKKEAATPTKRPYGGRKAKADEEKRQMVSARVDPSVKAALSGFAAMVATLPEDEAASLIPGSEHKNPTEADILQAMMLAFPAFKTYFEASEHYVAFQNRQERKAQAREDSKNRKRKIQDDERGPDDDGPGGGLPADERPVQETELAGAVSAPIEELATTLALETTESTTIRRVFYQCLSKFCQRHWIADYCVTNPGTSRERMYRRGDDNQVISWSNDFALCPFCQNNRRFIKSTILKHQYSGHRRCDSRCWNARPGSDCSCACGGSNHATGNNIQFIGTPLLMEFVS